jgi:hypothetical protein
VSLAWSWFALTVIILAFDLHGNKSSVGIGGLQVYRREREYHIAGASGRDKGREDSAGYGYNTSDAEGFADLFRERLLRVVTASGYVVELDESTYGPNPLTKALATRQTAGLVEFM